MKPEPIHLSFYQFMDLGPPEKLLDLRSRLFALCKSLEITGTILLAKEGINGMLEGRPDAMIQIRAQLEEIGVEARFFKEAPGPGNSFRRLLVKIKKEIVPVGDPSVEPHVFTAPRIEAKELRQWIAENRDFILLDTRNQYEVEVGTFRGAQTLGISHSRDFASSIAERRESWKHKTIVTFCTGGIRCEKASAVMLKQGFSEVYQLDGGILRYFEQNGDSYFDGSCFVFDWREAVDGQLLPVARSGDKNQSFGRHKKTDGLSEEGLRI